MNYTLHYLNGATIAELEPDPIIHHEQGFLEMAMNLPCEKIVIHQAGLDGSFFDLRSGLAGEILQKVTNYRLQLAIVGDFSGYESKSLHDFIYESNQSNTVAFVTTLEEALNRLSK